MRSPLLLGIPSLIAALAALAIPGVTNAANAEGTVLAVGALALLAGHGWGLIVVVSSHLSLVGRLCPAFALPGVHPAGGAVGAIAALVVLLMAVPMIALAISSRHLGAAWWRTHILPALRHALTFVPQRAPAHGRSAVAAQKAR